MTEEQRQDKAAARLASYRTFVASEEGQMVMLDLMQACSFTTSTMADTPELTAFNEGRRSVLLQIMETASLTPAEIHRMVGKVKQETNSLMDFGLDGDSGGTDEI